MSFVSSKPDPYPTPVDVVVYLISAIMNRVIKRFYCNTGVTWASGLSHHEQLFGPQPVTTKTSKLHTDCPTCRTSLIATRFWVVVICPIIKCLTVLEFSLILFDLCLFITISNFILNYVPIVTFWIFTYNKIRILLIIFCFIWNYWIIYFLNMFGSVLECCDLTGVSLLWPWLIKWK